MKKITLSKGFKPLLAGQPDESIIHLPEPETVAVSAMDIPFIRPRLLVKENDPVKIGTPVFCDKRNPAIQYVSPGSGHVKTIVFGPRRKLLEVVIRLDGKKQSIEFNPVSAKTFDSLSPSDLVKQLQHGGLWQCFRQFPSRDTADENHTPAMIIVSMNGNDLFSPDPGLLLEDQEHYYQFGLTLLKRFTDNIVVTCRQSCLPKLGRLDKSITHLVPDFYPSWDPGVVLYKLKTCVEENRSWTISVEHLIMAARFLLTGRYPTHRIFSVTRPHDKKPHVIARQGVPVKLLMGKIPENSLITTGRFNGRTIDQNCHMGFFETTLNIITPTATEEMFGFIQPGFNKPSVSSTFVSSLIHTPKNPDCNLHGEERACINCGYCARICPVDLMPSFIMKALHADDIEDALSYGLLDCTRCGLCSYTCPSKIELTHLLSQGMDTYFKDKE